MNVTQRFTLLVKGSIDAVLIKFEDPERSLNQLVLDMEDELKSASAHNTEPRVVPGFLVIPSRIRRGAAV
ncbi:MAG: hypothetical protein GWP18_04635 [Proteobacteria bacterium]|nr:hypothetical protein [Pseudomonadota bacterium]